MDTNKKNNSYNIYDISEKAGVSIATVSRVLNGSSKVSEKTRKKVQDAMAELNYQPNAFARGLGSGSMSTIGIMCTDASDTFLSAGLYYAESALRRKGYATILISTGTRIEDRKAAMEQILARKIDGLILVGSSFVEEKDDDNDYICFAAEKVPVVIINGYLNHNNVYCVSCNDFESVFQVTDSLLARGRKNILYAYGSHTYSGKQKLQGYRAALGANGMMVDPDHLAYVSKNVVEAKNQLKEYYKKGIPFDAIVASDDMIAVSAMKMAAECHLLVPEDVEITGYNNSILSQCTTPELSSVDNHIQILSERAVEILLAAISGEKVEQREIVPTEFVKRGSTYCI